MLVESAVGVVPGLLRVRSPADSTRRRRVRDRSEGLVDGAATRPKPKSTFDGAGIFGDNNGLWFAYALLHVYFGPAASLIELVQVSSTKGRTRA